MKTYYHTVCEILLESSEKHSVLKKALTHSSFYTDIEKCISDKYIFLGMYAFKGKLAEVIGRYIPLTGTQLQHYLGNLFANKQLEKIFIHYRLDRIVRYGKHFDVANKHHIFVYALLGFVSEFAEGSQLNRFIYRHFLQNSDHLRPDRSNTNNKDLYSKLLFLINMCYQQVPQIATWSKNKTFYCKVSVEAGWTIEEQGSSPKIAQQKCIKKALQQIADELNLEWKQNPISQELEQKRKKTEGEKKARAKAEKLKKYKEKQQKRSQEIAERKSQRKKEAMERDVKRRKAKMLAKKRKELLLEQQKKQKEALSTMSVAKRRHLQDKGLLEKGAPKR